MGDCVFLSLITYRTGRACEYFVKTALKNCTSFIQHTHNNSVNKPNYFGQHLVVSILVFASYKENTKEQLRLMGTSSVALVFETLK